MREDINRLIRSCYGGHNPDYPKLSVFEEGKFINLLIPYLKGEIEKMKPYGEAGNSGVACGYAQAIRDILAKLEEK